MEGFFLKDIRPAVKGGYVKWGGLEVYFPFGETMVKLWTQVKRGKEGCHYWQTLLIWEGKDWVSRARTDSSARECRQVK